MSLNVNSLLCCQCYACYDETAEARITRFFTTVALYLSYPQINFEDEMERKSSNFKHSFRLFYAEVKLMSSLRFIYSQMSQLLRLVTKMYGNERTFDK